MSVVTRTSSLIVAGRKISQSQASSDSGAPADALAHRGAPSDSASSLSSSPRPVIRGESPLPCGNQVIDTARESDFDDDWGAGSELLQERTRRRGSVRVNLSVPFEMDVVLLGLAELTGSSKASFVMEALHAYLPVLKRRLAEHNKLHHPQRRQVIRTTATLRTSEARPEAQHSLKLSRQERRRLERDQKKAAGRGGDRE
jgi:hypothetical protein